MTSIVPSAPTSMRTSSNGPSQLPNAILDGSGADREQRRQPQAIPKHSRIVASTVRHQGNSDAADTLSRAKSP